MEVTKHGQNYIDSHKIYNLFCKKCGCWFNAQRYEINAERIDKFPITGYIAHIYRNYGLRGFVKCPECGNTVSCIVSLTHDEEEYVDEHYEGRW